MQFILDSCVFIEMLRGRNERLVDTIRAHDPRSIKVSEIVRAELLYGARNSADPMAASSAVDACLAPFEAIPFDDAAARAYAQIRYELAKRGELIGPNDLLIAATALAHDTAVVTFNRREFDRVEGLTVETW